MYISSHWRLAAFLLAVSSTALFAQQADHPGVQPLEGGLWSVQLSIETPDLPAEQKSSTICIASEDLRDPLAYFAYKPSKEAGKCTQVERWGSGKTVNWLYKCTGGVLHEVSVTATFENNHQFRTTTTMRGAVANKSFVSSMGMDGDRIGPCSQP